MLKYVHSSIRSKNHTRYASTTNNPMNIFQRKPCKLKMQRTTSNQVFRLIFFILIITYYLTIVILNEKVKIIHLKSMKSSLKVQPKNEMEMWEIREEKGKHPRGLEEACSLYMISKTSIFWSDGGRTLRDISYLKAQ